MLYKIMSNIRQESTRKFNKYFFLFNDIPCIFLYIIKQEKILAFKILKF